MFRLEEKLQTKHDETMHNGGFSQQQNVTEHYKALFRSERGEMICITMAFSKALRIERHARF